VAREDSTFEDVKNDLVDAGIPEVTFLQSHYGPKPFWTEAKLESMIGASCQTLYAIRGRGVRYILALMRSSEADYPIAICKDTLWFPSLHNDNVHLVNFDQDPLTLALPSTEADSDPEKGKASITRYSNQNLGYNHDTYDSLRSEEADTFPTCFIINIRQSIFLNSLAMLAVLNLFPC
jgi:hypothetical protein